MKTFEYKICCLIQYSNYKSRVYLIYKEREEFLLKMPASYEDKEKERNRIEWAGVCNDSPLMEIKLNVTIKMWKWIYCDF